MRSVSVGREIVTEDTYKLTDDNNLYIQDNSLPWLYLKQSSHATAKA